jgi:hypothetical protein
MADHGGSPVYKPLVPEPPEKPPSEPNRGMKRVRDVLMLSSLVAGVCLIALAVDRGDIWERLIRGFVGMLLLAAFVALADTGSQEV